MTCPRCGASDKNIKYKPINIPKVKMHPINNKIPNGAKMIEICRTCGWESKATFNNGKWNYKTNARYET